MEKYLRKALVVILLITNVSFGGDSEAYKIYTILQGRLCLVSDIEKKVVMVVSYPHPTGSFEPEIKTLYKVNKGLVSFLISELDISKFDTKGYKQDAITLSFYEYYLQYIPYISNGVKYIHINAYRRDVQNKDGTPVEKLVLVMGGGTSYWHVTYNMEKNEFFDLKIN